MSSLEVPPGKVVAWTEEKVTRPQNNLPKENLPKDSKTRFVEVKASSLELKNLKGVSLGIGSKGERVRLFQLGLKEQAKSLGNQSYDPGEADGILGKQTLAAYNNWQKDLSRSGNTSKVVLNAQLRPLMQKGLELDASNLALDLNAAKALEARSKIIGAQFKPLPQIKVTLVPSKINYQGKDLNLTNLYKSLLDGKTFKLSDVGQEVAEIRELLEAITGEKTFSLFTTKKSFNGKTQKVLQNLGFNTFGPDAWDFIVSGYLNRDEFIILDSNKPIINTEDLVSLSPNGSISLEGIIKDEEEALLKMGFGPEDFSIDKRDDQGRILTSHLINDRFMIYSFRGYLDNEALNTTSFEGGKNITFNHLIRLQEILGVRLMVNAFSEANKETHDSNDHKNGISYDLDVNAETILAMVSSGMFTLVAENYGDKNAKYIAQFKEKGTGTVFNWYRNTKKNAGTSLASFALLNLALELDQGNVRNIVFKNNGQLVEYEHVEGGIWREGSWRTPTELLGHLHSRVDQEEIASLKRYFELASNLR